MDYGSKYTDKQILLLEKRIEQVYKQAEKEIADELSKHVARYAKQEALLMAKLAEGKITPQQLASWRRSHVFAGKLWKAKRDHCADVLSRKNELAIGLINDKRLDVFGECANAQGWWLAKTAGISLAVYNTKTVKRLVQGNTQLLPERKLKKGKDRAFSRRQLNNAVATSIIKGDSLPKATKRIADIACGVSDRHMRTIAKTAMTAAQNAGKLQSMEDVSKYGIQVEKEWNSAKDNRTRPSHRAQDGERRPLDEQFGNGCMYPADPRGPDEEIYNCRCAITAFLPEYDNAIPFDVEEYMEWKE